MKKYIFILAMTILCCAQIQAEKFKYTYLGVEFECKTDEGKVIITGFNRDAAKVVIPAEVSDKRGVKHNVTVVDLYKELGHYSTNSIVIEQGISEINDWCFINFTKLNLVYIPNTIARIGQRAFNKKCSITFNMPPTIKESDLIAGNAVFPQTAGRQNDDPFAHIDLSNYGNNNSEQSSDAEVIVEQPKKQGITPGTSDIDFNIPTSNHSRENSFCIIIANENYRQKDTPNVKYAAQDGKTFHNYCLRTLGMPSENVRYVSNASYIQMKTTIEWIQQIGSVYGKDANFIVYYTGHGVPDEKGNCKLIPSDVSINDVNNGFSLKDLYASLGEVSSNSVLLLIDACFSGNDREDVAAVDDLHKGIVREVKSETATGNVVVLTAASGTETALCYDEKAHGLFSYYVMKKLQDTKGDVSYGELYDYVKKEVMRKSIVAKGKKQTPSVTFSNALANNWKNIKF
ncbi:MAG: caspase family protein [Muribaculaceae bacterium]